MMNVWPLILSFRGDFLDHFQHLTVFDFENQHHSRAGDRLHDSPTRKGDGAVLDEGHPGFHSIREKRQDITNELAEENII